MLIGPGDFTYSGDPTTSPKDQVRFLIGDTETDDMLLTDAEIEWIISMHGASNIYVPAADAADLAGHKYSRLINRQVGTMQLSMGGSNPFKERAEQLRLIANDRNVAPVFANDSLASEVATYGGRRPPLFWLGQFDYDPSSYTGTPKDRYGQDPDNGYPST